ncbi:MAG: nickel pincer cofactor biosynthesis protein LarB [Eggerthellales bacterium]|nr:nickel pincer cofactor biosynthesis protein LarB [Eggerthellales bacterium]
MDMREANELLHRVAAGEVTPEDAASALRADTVTDLGYATVDHQRGMRQGVSEVIFGMSKTPAQIEGICRSMIAAGQSLILITRLSQEKFRELPEDLGITYHEDARMGIIGTIPEPDGMGPVMVACAGTSDLPVAEEAALTAEALGNEVIRAYDVGVAGIHRLFAHADDIARARVIIAIAGMEGALASVIGGMASCPVIAVPTSVGYGTSFGGVTALLSMLNSCASGVSVVNIDNGFGAAYQAHLINHVANFH